MVQNLTPMERLRQSGVRPDRALGQNFLIDPNILDVTEQMAELAPGDVILEVGPGLGVLTERLLQRCRAVHCLELDPGLAGMLEAEFGGQEGFFLHRGDAMKLPLATLQPPPGKFVANLPYNVAAPLVMRSLAELPGIGLWCLMLQKEIADRFFAAVGAANYGGISVMVQLLTEKLASRQISGSVFYPRPRVRSSLLAFRRRQDAGQSYTAQNFAEVRAFVAAAFSHRRKTLVNSLADAEAGKLPAALAGTGAAVRKRMMEDLLERAGIAVNARPQELAPPRFEELARRVAENPSEGE